MDRDRVIAFEALLRWQHPQFGSVPPSEFIPIAEELGLMVPLGKWVLQQACSEAVRWPEHVSVSVNVSPAQFGAGQLLQTIMDVLHTTRLPASRLSLEVTETVLFSKSSSSLAVIKALRNIGVRTSLDDFGTGYSSLSYLANFPIDQIKIDQSFIRNLDNTSTAIIVQAIIGLADNLSLRVVAEGVETLEQMRWLRDAGCNDVQGYLLAQPSHPSEVATLAKLRVINGNVARIQQS
jgi:EAL domain-containing protein (putative c-di-GMP-specific phosphodiesterase class I)